MSSFSSDSRPIPERVNAFLEVIDEKRDLNAFVTVNEHGAMRDAIDGEERRAAGLARPLEGLVIAIKDNISVKGLPLTCASKILDGFEPVYNATVIERLQNAGAIIVGKTNMDEFAMGSSNENSVIGPAKHPIDPDYVPGGSSGGSAVAVAAGMCHVSLGSDTGGSVRQPAAFCGVVGFKPSYGRISRYGVVAFASSLDQIGIFANTVEDVAATFDVIAGTDPMDSTTFPEGAPRTLHAVRSGVDLSTLRIGVMPDSLLDGTDTEIMSAYHKTLQRLRDAGATIINVEIPNRETWIPTYFILATAEASSNLARFDGVRYGFRAQTTDDEDPIVATRSQGFGDEVKRRIMLGTYVLSSGYYDAYYRKAQQSRRIIADSYAQIFSSCDVMLMPTTPTPPFKRGSTTDPVKMWLNDFFTVSANIAGIPAISIPAGTTSNGFPIGLQLQAGLNEDEKLLVVAHAVRAAR
jgi:aspartyl-tRNA(Asn)/glutamyl-tRNA(Gln) amidotransferase subunit A